MGELALAVEGSDNFFPELGAVMERLRAIDSLSWSPGCTFRPPDPSAVKTTLPKLRTVAIRNACGTAVDTRMPATGDWLVSPVEEERVHAFAQARKSAEFATHLRAPVVILHLGELIPANPAQQFEPSAFRQEVERRAGGVLDPLCRGLFELVQEYPELHFAIALPRVQRGLPTPGMLESVLDDLHQHRLGVWLDTGQARWLQRLELYPEHEWLDRFGARCLGVDLTDFAAGFSGLPAGSGELRFQDVRDGIGNECLRVVRADPFPGLELLSTAAAYLRGAGF